MTTVDLNCDLGEGFGAWTMGDDAGLLGVVSSANVACGFHGGDPTIMRGICETAAARGITVGAHVGYRDLAGFGRREIAVPATQLADDVLYQLAALDGIARVAGTRVRYVKPHGALYNTIVHDAEQAAAVVDAARSYDPTLTILGLPGSEVLRIATVHGLSTVPEAFGDRAYHTDGRLVSRRRPGAVITDPGAVAARCLELATTGTVTSIEGEPVAVRARSLCVHGDTPGAVGLLRRVREVLTEHGITIAAFA
ncbi:LamB/YcsF family protein [Jiangella ureilytica]|uniref:5-oxoprolinase subunit A n=2 Tax=Jiangella ureilytica TaxID=2530374 RepID=A0A4V2XXD2_9ACTN|nr:5-oxoprolinase subunit PxpA [Jiangella ureilytica]TDC52645.1 LamB/YcsF family protein [Jiangella ureilytica]